MFTSLSYSNESSNCSCSSNSKSFLINSTKLEEDLQSNFNLLSQFLFTNIKILNFDHLLMTS
jgi:hypothetical protein